MNQKKTAILFLTAVLSQTGESSSEKKKSQSDSPPPGQNSGAQTKGPNDPKASSTLFQNLNKKRSVKTTIVPPAERDYREECRAAVAGLYVDMTTQIDMEKKNLEILARKISNLKKKKEKDKTELQKLESESHTVTENPELDTLIKDKSLAFRTLLDEIRNTESLMDGCQKRITDMTAEKSSLKTRILKVFTITAYTPHPLTIDSAKIDFRSPVCYGPHCRIDPDDAAALKEIFPGGRLDKSCGKYIKNEY
ncbi:MAG: hypothetical protein HQK54_03970 [Oligoflexales bacterium]|nr:hypothetical protein [Oligoflexales bacterium]